MTDQRQVARIVPYAVLAGAIVLFFWDSFFAGKIFCMRDMFCDFMPWREFTRQAFALGKFPLWNHYAGLGKPFAADPQTAVFYPLHVLFLIFPAAAALKISLALHLFVAGASMVGLARQWKMSLAPALLCAITFIFSTWMIASLEFLPKVTTIAWTPLSMLIMSRWTDHWLAGQTAKTWFARFWDSMVWTALLGIIFALQYLAGHPPVYLYSLILLFLYALALGVVHKDVKLLAGILCAFLLAGGIALLLALPQFLSSWELIQYSERSTAFDPQMDGASFHPRHLLTLLLPYLYGHPGRPEEYWGGSISSFFVGTCYVGILPLMLVLLSFIYLRKFRAHQGKDSLRFLIVFWGAIGILGLLLSAGKFTPLYQWCYDTLPGFNRFRWPSNFLIWDLFALSMLSAAGYQVLLDNQKREVVTRPLQRGILCLWGLILLGVIGAGVFLPKYLLMAPGVASGFIQQEGVLCERVRMDIFIAALFVGTAIIVLLLAFSSSRRNARGMHAIVLAVAFLDLFVVCRQIHFITADNIYDVEPKTVKTLVSNPFPNRVHNFCGPAQPWLTEHQDPSIYHWAKAAGVGDAWLPSRIFQTSQGGMKLEQYNLAYSLLAVLPPAQGERLMDLMNIRTIVVGNDTIPNILWNKGSQKINVIDRPTCLPRAYLVDSWEPMRDPREIVQTLLSESFDPRRQAIVDSSSVLSVPMEISRRAPADAGKTVPSDVQSIQYETNQVCVNFHAQERSLLVLNDAWYPGWKALVDGRPQPIWRVNWLFRGVFVEPGVHSVLFVYDPWQFRFGGVVSLITAMALAAFFFMRFKRLHGVQNLPAKIR